MIDFPTDEEKLIQQNEENHFLTYSPAQPNQIMYDRHQL